MKYILFSLHGYLELFKKRGEKTLFDYARKYNFEKFMENGKWGYVKFDNKIEKGYFKFLMPKNIFPGEGFLRALKYKIPTNKNETIFLCKFVFSVDGKIVETEIFLNLEEKKALIEAIKKEKNNFDFFVFEEDIILKFYENLTLTENGFPNKIKNRNVGDVLYKKDEFRKINKIMEDSLNILNIHPVNKVKSDLNEPCANFLYFYGMGKSTERIEFSDIIKKDVFYFSDSETLKGLKEFLKFEEMGKIDDIKDNTLYWLNFSLDYKNSPSIWVKNFENFSKDILSEISYKEDIKFLFIFDPFMDENYEYENGLSLFLGVNFPSRIRSKYKNSSILFQKFIE